MNPDPIDTQIATRFQKTLALMLARQDVLEKKGIHREGIFYLPMGRNKEFIGRDAEMTILEKTLKKEHRSTIHAVCGMGGLGKSQLALEYAYRHEKEYALVYWIRSEYMETLKADYRTLGQEMGIAEEFLRGDKAIPTMKGVLENRKGWLLIFDNAEDPRALAQALPQRGGDILITSRNPNWDSKLSLDVFSETEALFYLQNISGLSGQKEELAKLSEELGRLPLALSQAGAYINMHNLTVANYRAIYAQLLSTRTTKDYPNSVATALSISMEKIEKQSPNAALLLDFCSFLSPDNIPAHLLNKWLKSVDERCRDIDFHDALRILESYSLITQRVEQREASLQKTISLHRLIQAVIRDKNKQTDADSIIRRGIDVLTIQFKGDIGNAMERQDAEILAPHVQVLLSHQEKRGFGDVEVTKLMHELGIFFRITGNLNGAQVYHEKALSLRIANNGLKYPAIVESYIMLGDVLTDRSDLWAAKEYYQEALKVMPGYNEYGDQTVAKVYRDLARVHLRKGDLDSARVYCEKALKIFTAIQENHHDLAKSYRVLGCVLAEQGHLSEAKKYLDQALTISIASNEKENHMTWLSSMPIWQCC